MTDGDVLYFNYTVLTLSSVPVPSNWTYFAFSNSSSNATTVKSGTVKVSVTSEVLPEVNIIVPENKTYGASFVTDIETTGNYESCWYSLDGGNNVPYTCNTGFRLTFDTEGSHTLFAYANDSKNNIASDNVTFYVEPWTAFYAAYDRLPNITFASSDWVTGSITKFNISGVPSANLIMMGSANLKKLDKPGQTVTVWARVLVDGSIKSTQKLRTVSNTIEGSVSFKPVSFSVNASEHNLTIQYKREGVGLVSVNDIDFSLGQFNTIDGGVVEGYLNESEVSFNSTGFSSIYNFSLLNLDTPNSSVYLTVVHTDSADSAGNSSYYIDNLNDGSSSYSLRYIKNDNDIGSLVTTWIDDNVNGQANYSLMASQTDTDVTTNFTLIYFLLDNNNTRMINSNYSTNSSSNVTNVLTLPAGTHLLSSASLTMQAGNQTFLTFTASAGSGSGEQVATFFVNTSYSDCYSKKERELSSNSDIGDATIFLLCDDQSVGQTYEFHAWVTVEPGETLTVYDESLSIFETETKDISTANLPPIANDFVNPINPALLAA